MKVLKMKSRLFTITIDDIVYVVDCALPSFDTAIIATMATTATTITTVISGFIVKIVFGFVRLPRDSCQSSTAFNWVTAL